ncbi:MULTISPECIES: SDR family NAD(P)-dependent oxidoreductase [unclassified Sphingomonas]|uniref:SDR family NAD(P)-dependent oxidoreductase n=1 Tax=unclassified Sphingomonas TaxID=196159 RepID=UPI0006F96BB9|nr:MULTISPECIES: SDR family NAD(P)-dependent oxidoreductase [unclassified Sphingomonas]KQX23387.1 hypothetical protein ASD17_03535 [Sphingomonas sp. Root1294]KQY68238.1 hypothetical protein ASD39_06055 [Sphingomonas sp. Root50]KRB91135.1 hypothetical protein ASE22_12855 [Sphingomonas sp. Root720]
MAGGRLRGRRILISGAAQGIGLAAAEACVAEGARVVLLDRNASAVEAVATRLGTAAIAVAADIADEDAVAQAIARTAEALGGLDGLVNCAGVVGQGLLAETSLAEWRRLMDVNLTGTFLVTRATLPLLMAAAGGAIVNISSNQALRPEAKLSGYAAAKAGVVAMTRSLAAELAPAIRVNCICPGTIDTPMSQAAIPADAPIENNAMRRRGTPEEVASMIVYLLGDEAGFVNGATLAVDGGRTFH